MMKHLPLIVVSAFLLLFVMCRTVPSPNNALCKICSNHTAVTHTPDSAGSYFYLPTAFTPDGDGLNDRFGLWGSNIDTAATSITVFKLSGEVVFTGNGNAKWDGFDTHGNKCGAAQYPVYLSVRTNGGKTETGCTCVTLLVPSGGCVKTNGITYFFPDQIDSAGFSFVTMQPLCP